MAQHWSHNLANNKSTASIPVSGERFIYLVAGSRNLESCQTHGGLFANIGQTDRDVTERLADTDYSRKAAGGNWVILAEWTVPNWISDHDVHAILRTKEGLTWGNQTNTEEFFFIGEACDAKIAKTIVESAICCAIMNAARSLVAGTKADVVIPAICKTPIPHTVAGFDAVSSKWRDIAAKETLWRKKAQQNLGELEKLPAADDIAKRFLCSLAMSFAIFGMLFLLKPSIMIMLFVCCPILTIIAITSEVRWLRAMVKKSLARAKDLG